MTTTTTTMTMTDWKINSKPMAHQLAALDHIVRSRVSALFMDMGTGKSLTAMLYIRKKRKHISKVIWCCPVSLKANTRAEILKHTSCSEDDICVFDQKITDKTLPDCFWYIVGLESIGSSDRVMMAFNALIDDRTMIIVDESSYIKGHKARRTKRLILSGEKSAYRMVLNGTPITQGIEDLYTQMTFLSHKILGYKSWYTFAKKHLEFDSEHPGMIRRRFAQDWLMRKMAPYVYQVTKEECLDLPDKTWSDRVVPLTSEQSRLYKEAKYAVIKRLKEMECDFYDSSLPIKLFMLFFNLQLIVNGIIPAGMDNAGEVIETNKTGELINTLQGIDKQAPVIIWVFYLKSIDVIKKALAARFPETNISLYHGNLTEKQRAEELQRWREKGGYFIATGGCGGFGLTLTEAKYAIFYTSGFKYSERIQSEDRIHRIGQDSNVLYISLWTDSGIEDRIRSALQRKGDALDDLREKLKNLKNQDKEALISYLEDL